MPDSPKLGTTPANNSNPKSNAAVATNVTQPTNVTSANPIPESSILPRVASSSASLTPLGGIDPGSGTNQAALLRRFSFIKSIALISTIAAAGSALLFLGIAVVSGSGNNVALLLAAQDLIASLLFALAFGWARYYYSISIATTPPDSVVSKAASDLTKDNPNQQPSASLNFSQQNRLNSKPNSGGVSVQRANQISYFLVVTVIGLGAIYQWLLGTGSVTPAVFLLIPIYAGILGLGVVSITVMSLLGGVLLAVSSALEKIYSVYTPPLEVAQNPLLGIGLWLTILAIVATGIAFFANRLNTATVLAETQSQTLNNLLASLNATNQAVVASVRELSGITTDLNATSRQQASSSQEQVSATSQVTSSIEEVNETSSQIAGNAENSAGAARQTLVLANEVVLAGEQAQATTVQGNDAVQETIGSVELVRLRIETLGERLLNLTEQTRKVSGMVELIDGIAAETHLLALNASIEAAGSLGIDREGDEMGSGGSSGRAGRGGMSGYNQIRGKRFGVIAQEVKNLSDRSREATEEIRQNITEMRGAVAGAVLVAEEAKKEAFQALTRSRIAGNVIDTLTQVISDAVHRAVGIQKEIEGVTVRSDEISFATNQQRSAMQQVLLIMRGFITVSQENAQSAGQIASASSRVDQQLLQLNMVLNAPGFELAAVTPPATLPATLPAGVLNR